MNMLAFSTLACPGWSIETILEKAVEFGYGGIEWRGGADDMSIQAYEPQSK